MGSILFQTDMKKTLTPIITGFEPLEVSVKNSGHDATAALFVEGATHRISMTECKYSDPEEGALRQRSPLV